MGRTLPTQVQMLRDEEEAWKNFRRALREEDRAAFDVVWSYTRRHAMAASMAARLIPFEAHCMSMLVGLERELMTLKNHLQERLKEHCRIPPT
jgi:hypothetical protein